MDFGARAVILAFISQTRAAFVAGAGINVNDIHSLIQSSANHRPSFASFIAKYDRNYVVGSAEYEERQQLFQQRLKFIQTHNSRSDRRWTAGVNHLTDRTEAELARLNGWRGVSVKKTTGRHHFANTHSHVTFSLAEGQKTTLPESKDWSYLKSVKADVDQGSCGGCWATASSISLNSGAEIKGINRSFSAQDFLCGVPNPHDCGGQGGCKGATVELAYHYAMEHGVKTQAEVPYAGTDSQCMKDDESDFLFRMGAKGNDHLAEMIAIGVHRPSSPNAPGPQIGFVAWERLPENKYEPLMRAVVEHGPVAVSVDGSKWSWYQGGVFDGCHKNAIVGHGVTLVGYGKDGLDKYWNIKNSWGLNWGENGHIRLLRKDDEETEQCGIDNKPELGTGCKGGPSEVKVCGMCAILYDSVVPFFKNPAGDHGGWP